MVQRLALLLCIAVSALLWPGPSPAAPAMEYLASYDTLLASYVRDGQQDGIIATLVGYDGWSHDPLHEKAIQQLTSVPADALTGDDAAAFWINAYNLCVIDLIVRHHEKVSIYDIGTVLDTPWKSFHWVIGNTSYSLAEMQHAAFTAKANDPRLHFALADGTLSGPDLLMEAYRPEQLEQQLSMQATVFLQNESKGLKAFGTILQASRIFRKYPRDFESAGGADSFIRTYLPTLQNNATIQSFFEQNRSLNGSWNEDVPTEGATKASAEHQAFP